MDKSRINRQQLQEWRRMQLEQAKRNLQNAAPENTDSMYCAASIVRPASDVLTTEEDVRELERCRRLNFTPEVQQYDDAFPEQLASTGLIERKEFESILGQLNALQQDIVRLMLKCAERKDIKKCLCFTKSSMYDFSDASHKTMTAFQNEAKVKCEDIIVTWANRLQLRGMDVRLGYNFQWVQFDYVTDDMLDDGTLDAGGSSGGDNGSGHGGAATTSAAAAAAARSAVPEESMSMAVASNFIGGPGPDGADDDDDDGGGGGGGGDGKGDDVKGLILAADPDARPSDD